ncbi:MAG: amino acid decarboxylase [Actinobacteria bacterium]|nr:amino acid decarboxylase [Actinomycetota bacterium]
MPTDELRRHGRAALDWVADYLDRVGDLPVLPRVGPGDIRRRLPSSPPVRGEPVEAILADLDRLLDGVTHWNHPRFFAYFAITGSGPGILAELVTAALNLNPMLWRTAPAATELEQVVTDWLRQLLGLPSAFRGVIFDTASTSTLVALAAARERELPGVRETGLAGVAVRGRVYASGEVNASVEKALITLGLGRDGLRTVATDAAFRMQPGALAEAIDDDVRAGWLPLAVVATVGTTSSTSIDPLTAVAEVCRRHRVGADPIWLHVDGAYGGIAAVAPELRHVLDGASQADSVVVNPHKWLFTPIGCSTLYVRDVGALKRVFSLAPVYLRTDDGVEDYTDWGFQLGRRFRALKLWMVLRYFGADGLAARIREHVRLAQLVADWVDRHDRFERVAPVPLSTVCLRARYGVDPVEEDRRNGALLDAVNASGTAFLSHTQLRGRAVLRIAIGNLRTTEEDVRATLEVLEREAERLVG